MSVLAADNKPIDCALPHTDNRINECTIVRQASEFPGCLSASDLEGHTCVVMDTDLTFCQDQPPIPVSAYFDQSGKTLDCAGGTIHHGQSENRKIPFVRLRDDESLSDITVRNCTMRSKSSVVAVQMIRFFGGELGADGVLDEGEVLPLGHHNILLEDLIIQGGGVGIYVGNYSRDVTIQRVHIDQTKRIAIYSEAGSHRISIIDSIITNNLSREAVALDSTYDSEIRDTLFVNNREGGIYLYQNCGELKGTVCPVERSTPSNNNRIIDNVFVHSGIAGVQIASRQGRRHSLGWCQSLHGLPGLFTDTAQDNLIDGNVFVCREGTSLVVMDGPNTISNNLIVARDKCVPYEISTGGLGNAASGVLEGLMFNNNRIDSTRPPRLRNLGKGVSIVD
ncbi:MAG: right-handed parallel beta-helix repeat-containing protein [Granulosicoccus sp.]